MYQQGSREQADPNTVRMLQSMTAQIRVKLITGYLAVQLYQEGRAQRGKEKR